MAVTVPTWVLVIPLAVVACVLWAMLLSWLWGDSTRGFALWMTKRWARKNTDLTESEVEDIIRRHQRR